MNPWLTFTIQMAFGVLGTYIGAKLATWYYARKDKS